MLTGVPIVAEVSRHAIPKRRDVGRFTLAIVAVGWLLALHYVVWLNAD
jgi:hypothetical protein